MEAIFGPLKECYAYFDPQSAATYRTALQDLKDFIASESPFDGIMGYSQGAGLAASLLLQESAAQPQRMFKYAIFLSGMLPCDPLALERGEVCWLDPMVVGEVISIPTVHIWGQNDEEYPVVSSLLFRLCDSKNRKAVLHDLAHHIPMKDEEVLQEMVQAVHETTGKECEL